MQKLLEGLRFSKNKKRKFRKFILIKNMGKIKILFQFVQFLKVRKKYWLFPIVIVFALIGFLLMVSEGSIVAPFIYTLF